MLHDVLFSGVRRWRRPPRYFLALLEALQFQHPAPERLLELDVTEWQKLLSFSDRAHLTLQLSQLPSGILPSWVASRIQQNLTDNTLRMARVRRICNEAMYFMQRAGADHIVLKGFAQYPDFVKSPNLRMQSDIDFYCPADAIFCAQDALREIGYESEPERKHVPMDHLPALTREGKWRWKGNAFDPDMPLGIELHYCLWNQATAQFAIPEIDGFWHRRVERELDGVRFPALNPIDHAGFVSLHVLRGLLRGDWVIHHTYELAYFLQTHARDQFFWRAWQRMHSNFLRSLEAISFCLARILFGCALPQEVEAQIEELPPAVRQWLCCFSSSCLEWMFLPSRDGIWLNVALAPSAKAKASAIRRGLLPVRVPPLTIADRTPSLERKIVSQSSSLRSLRYVAYVSGRASFYTRVLMRTICGGLRWWHSQRRSLTCDFHDERTNLAQAS